MSKNIIMLHHSATWDSKEIKDFDAIKAGHLAIGDRDVGYHWVIEYADGKLQTYQGRQESDSAAACPGYNFNAIHICLVGNFEESTPTEEEYQAIAGLCRDIMTRWPITEVCGHRDYYATACPGANFNVDKVKEFIKEGEEDLTEVDIDVKGKILKGFIINGISYVPVREFVESNNSAVLWDDVSKKVIIK